MNRLKNTRFYLSGPIDDVPDLGKDWRDYVTAQLKERYSAKVYDPLHKPMSIANEEDMRSPRANWKTDGEFYKLAEFMGKIRHVDLRMVYKCDALIVYLDMSRKMAGTWEELFVGNMQNKPCLIVCPQGVRAIPDWVFGTIDPYNMHDSFDSLFCYLDYINGEPIKSFDDERRWIFFDQETE